MTKPEQTACLACRTRRQAPPRSPRGHRTHIHARHGSPPLADRPCRACLSASAASPQTVVGRNAPRHPKGGRRGALGACSKPLPYGQDFAQALTGRYPGLQACALLHVHSTQGGALPGPGLPNAFAHRRMRPRGAPVAGPPTLVGKGGGPRQPWRALQAGHGFFRETRQWQASQSAWRSQGRGLAHGHLLTVAGAARALHPVPV